MVEEITQTQKAAAEEAKAICQAGAAQMAQQVVDDIAKKTDQAAKDALKQLNEANRKIAQIPEDAMLKLKDVENKLWKIIAGLEDPKSPTWDGKAIVVQIQALLDPVIAGLSSLPVPEIPGLSDISELLAKLMELMAMTPESCGISKEEMMALVPQKPDLPTHLLETLKSLVEAIQTLCMTLPIVMVNLAFDMLSAIYDMFDQIAGYLGFPPAVFPFSLIKQVPKVGSDIKDLIVNAPGKVNNVVKGVIQEKLQLISALKHPALPTDPPTMSVPENLPACPQRENS